MLQLLRNIKRNTNIWYIISLLGAVIVLLPNSYILVNLFTRPNENWQQIKQYMLKDYILNSLALVIFTGLLTVLIGVLLAWLVSAFDFPLKRFFRFAFVLPLSIPPYIAAYTYSSMLSYTGVFQTFLRNQWGIVPNQKYFNMMSVQGAVFIFTMFLFPYVYMITKTFLERQSSAFIENARLLRKGPLQIFLRIVLPISQAAIIGGVSLVIFEVLSDYGVSSYFGIRTFSTAIFQTWFGMYDVDSAIRLAAYLMIGIIGVFVIERYMRSRRKFSSTTSKIRPLMPIKLRGIRATAAVAFCTIIFLISFLIPFIQLMAWAGKTYQIVLNASFIELILRTVSVSMVATMILMVLAIVVANVVRLRPTGFTLMLSRLVSMGYSIPGAVIAIGVLAVFIALDNQLGWLYGWLGLGHGKLVLSSSLIMLIIAYVIRFLAVGYNSVEAGFEKTGNRYFEASRMLGMGMTKTFFKVDIHLIKGAALSGFILAYMEIIKELPLTLLLRPFNFDTLATKAFQYANDEQIQHASIPSLFIIAIGLISVVIYHKLGEKKR